MAAKTSAVVIGPRGMTQPSSNPLAAATVVAAAVRRRAGSSQRHARLIHGGARHGSCASAACVPSDTLSSLIRAGTVIAGS
ncbi:MAG TPA: hypothetical protein VK899_06905 [Gemmatimonadales bacterium]|nr:hypothetical protein [Gemmatimonadales bacterium]